MARLQDLLGIEHPVIQAPMAGSQDSALALAVSATGALGSLPAAMLSAAALRTELTALRAQTSHPINVNFFCHAPPAPAPAREAAWRASLAPYYREFGLQLGDIPAAPARAPFDHALAEVLEELRPQIVSFHFGLPEPSLLSRVKRTGAKVLSSATKLAEARWLETRGVDAIIAQGLDAGAIAVCSCQTI